MRDIFEEAKESQRQPKWWLFLIVLFFMVLISDVAATFMRAFFLMIAALIFGAKDYIPSYDVQAIILYLSGFGSLVGVILCLLFFEYRSPDTLGYYRETAKKEIGLGIVLGLFAFAIVMIGLLPFTQLRLSANPFHWYQIVVYGLYAISFFAWSLGNVVIFQGYVLPVLSRRLPIGLALMVATFLELVFDWLKQSSYTWYDMLSSLIAALLIGLIVIWRRDLWAATLFSAVILFCTFQSLGQGASVISFVHASVTGPDFFTGGQAGLLASPWFNVIQLTCCAVLAWHLRKQLFAKATKI